MLDPKENSVTKMFTCNHEEADTRMIYHASRQGESNVVISANDSDILFLGTYACALDAKRKWYFNYQSNTFADLRRVSGERSYAFTHILFFDRLRHDILLLKLLHGNVRLNLHCHLNL